MIFIPTIYFNLNFISPYRCFAKWTDANANEAFHCRFLYWRGMETSCQRSDTGLVTLHTWLLNSNLILNCLLIYFVDLLCFYIHTSRHSFFFSVCGILKKKSPESTKYSENLLSQNYLNYKKYSLVQYQENCSSYILKRSSKQKMQLYLGYFPNQVLPPPPPYRIM